jgi:hypothetical protein
METAAVTAAWLKLQAPAAESEWLLSHLQQLLAYAPLCHDAALSFHASLDSVVLQEARVCAVVAHAIAALDLVQPRSVTHSASELAR